MPVFTPEALALTPPLTGQLAYDLVGGKVVPVSKVVLGNDGEAGWSWSFNAGPLDDGTPRVVLATDQPAYGVKLTDGVETATIRDVTAAKALDVAIVDAAGNQITSFGGGSGGGTEYDEDTPHVSGDKLRLAGVVRDDAPAGLASADGDRTVLTVDALNRLYCNVHTSELPSGAATSANQTTEIGHLATLAGAVTAARVQADVLSLPALAAGTNNIGGVDVLSLPSLPAGANTIGAVAVASLPALPAGANSIGQVTLGTGGNVIGAVSVTALPALPAGANSIGEVTLGTGANIIGSVSVNSLPGTAADGALALPSQLVVIAGWDGTSVQAIATDDTGKPQVEVTNLTEMTDGDRSRVIYDGVTQLTVKHAAISAALSGNNTLVAAVTAKKIRVLSLFLVAAGTVTATFENGAAGTDLSGPIPLTANSGFSLARNQDGWFADTTANTLLNLSLSAAVQVSGALSYIEVD